MAKPVIVENRLFIEVARLIDESRSLVAHTVNSTLTLLYYKIGRRVNEEILLSKRAEYGKKIFSNLSYDLTLSYGNNFSEKNLRRMM